MQNEIFTHHAEHRNMGAIFTRCTGAFKEAIERASIQLPMGQLTHVLRHTFASHFMINGGNILTLQRILGHQDLKTTMRYAHLAPDHLDSARQLNPLVFLPCTDGSTQSGSGVGLDGVLAIARTHQLG
ncbi:tyrosine-type recombinase/integrase [Kerstersia gyiorum]|uniref:tyrosine-type recombinase/integrase n=1 Tax=Kerstersia gyiorum TaxID=206506 RepID=UPI003C6D0D76